MWARLFRSRSPIPPALPQVRRRGFSDRIRIAHRWVALAFTLAVIANIVALAQGPVPLWITYSPLLPLFALMLTGLIMWVLPYTRTKRARR
jgi:hypothetical protein